MPLPSRSPAPDASSRVVALVGVRRQEPMRPGGWTPEQPAFPPAPDAVPEVSSARPQVEALVAVPQAAPVVPADEVVVPGTVAALLRSGRIDPGRRGVLALAAVGVVAAVVAAVVLLRGRPSEQPLTAPVVVGAGTSTAAPQLVVDVAGKVSRPGLVRLQNGARVGDALKAAGGVLPGASTGVLNLARKVADGEQVLVGLDGPAAQLGGAAGPAAGLGAAAGGRVDLNTATAQDLDALPGIGPVLADRIVSWRTEHGRFASLDQLREVSGIGERKYQSLKSKVRL